MPITPLAAESTAMPGEASSHEGEEGIEGNATTWHDVALSIGAELMGKIREEVRVKLGYTTSAVR